MSKLGDIVQVNSHLPIDHAGVWSMSQGGLRLAEIKAIWERHCVIHLIHTMPEFATDYDTFYDQGHVLPYPIVVENDLVGCIWHTDIIKTLANTTNVPESERGLPMADNQDNRWQFKVDECKVIQGIANDFLSTVWADE